MCVDNYYTSGIKCCEIEACLLCKGTASSQDAKHDTRATEKPFFEMR